MTKYYTLKDRLWYEMSELYYVQKNSEQLLPKLGNESHSPQLKSLISKAQKGVSQELHNLESCFQQSGIRPEEVTGETVMGLRQEHALLDAQRATQEQMTLYDLHALAKILAYEVAAYRSIADTARLLGERGCETTLESDLQNVEQLQKETEDMRKQIGLRVTAGA